MENFETLKYFFSALNKVEENTITDLKNWNMVYVQGRAEKATTGIYEMFRGLIFWLLQ
jgi:hypothetical protein